jgi:hypothetical protein
MQVDGKLVALGGIFYDDVLGAGTVTALYVDSFKVTFGPTSTRVYFDGGLLAGRKLLNATLPFVVFPTAAQEPLLIKLLAAIDVTHNRL